jgi:hypothetical protein
MGHTGFFARQPATLPTSLIYRVSLSLKKRVHAQNGQMMQMLFACDVLELAIRMAMKAMACANVHRPRLTNEINNPLA